MNGRGQRDEVAEDDAAREQRRRHEHEENDAALCDLLHRRGEEGPQLPEDDGQSKQEAGVEADLERGQERLGDTERDRLADPSLRKGTVEPVDQRPVEDVTDDQTEKHSSQTTLSLARRHSLSVSDAAYLELAMRLALPLGSKDRPLRKVARAVGIRVLPGKD